MASSARTSVDHQHEPEHVELPATTSSPHSLSRAVHARRAEYTRSQQIKIKIGSWNVAACPGTEQDLAAWFVEGKGIDKHLAPLKIQQEIEQTGSQEGIESVADQEERTTTKQSTLPKGDEGAIVGGDEIGLYVLGLQEVVDLNSAREYIGRVYTDPEPTSKWMKTLMDALPPGYTMVTTQQLSGLLLFIFASPSVAPTISSVSTVSVGTGIMGYLGNKGAVSTRMVLGETTRLVFVNSHLASGSDPAHLDRRCWDVTQILQRTQFDPISWGGVLEDTGEGIGDEDFAFWFGDLNFRLDGLPGDDIRRLLMLHAKGEYDIGTSSRSKMEAELAHADEPIVVHSIDSGSDSGDEMNTRTGSAFDKADDSSSDFLPDPDDFIQDPSQDPASLQATLDSLLPHDQLKQVQKHNKAFHDGWREGPITFLPTYKYDVGTMGVFDSSEKKRAPSWCDRILFRTRKDKLDYEKKVHDAELARIKDEEMKARGIDEAGDDESVLFDYDPDEDCIEEVEPEMTSKKADDYDEYDEGEVESPEEVVTQEGFVDKIHLDVYTSHQRVLSSDHKPLDAVFTLEYDAVVPELKAHVQQEVARELDRAENEGRPGITLVVDHSMYDNPSSPQRHSSASEAGVDFGAVAFLQRKSRSMTIANTSQVAATFSFVDRPSATDEPDRIGPAWLSVCFVGSETDEDERVMKDMKREITLEPGDAVNATLELFIDNVAMIRDLNDSKMQLDDVLVLRVTNGRDHFIPIRGTWLQSCLCRSIDQLIRVPEGGVRALVPARDGSGVHVNRGQDVCWSAPRELFKLTETVETLTDRVIADSSMLESAQIPQEPPGWPFYEKTWLLKDKKERDSRKAYVLEALDSDKNLNEAFPPEIPAIERLEIVAEILLLFLRSLTDGIVPEPLFANLEQDMSARGAKQLTDTEEIKAWTLEVLSSSPNHNISFVFLASMLGRLASELVPVPKTSWKESKRSSMEAVRRSLSWKGKAPAIPNEKEVLHRQATEKAFAEAFKDAIFRGPGATSSAKERRVAEDRKREILEGVLRGNRGP
jgi:phosphatidylinositol-bisphosphatase